MSDFKKVDQLIKRNEVKKEKPKYVDDGRAITDMNVEGFSWYIPQKYSKEKQQLSDLKITRKERIAMILGALQAILPVAITMMLLFFGVFLFIAFWLS